MVLISFQKIILKFCVKVPGNSHLAYLRIHLKRQNRLQRGLYSRVAVALL